MQTHIELYVNSTEINGESSIYSAKSLVLGLGLENLNVGIFYSVTFKNFVRYTQIN